MASRGGRHHPCAYLADVGALCLDADGVELELADGLPQASVLLTLRSALPQPRGLLHLRIPPGVRPRGRPRRRPHRWRRLSAAPCHGYQAPSTAASGQYRRPQRPREGALHRCLPAESGAASGTVEAVGSRRRTGKILAFPFHPLCGSGKANQLDDFGGQG